MKRFILTFVVVLATVFNAKAGWYLVGDVNGWNEKEPLAFTERANGDWTLYLDSSRSLGNFKLINDIGSWDSQFSSNGSNITLGIPYAMEQGDHGNIVVGGDALPDVFLVIKAVDGKCYLTIYKDIYVVAYFNSWAVDSAPLMTLNRETNKFEYSVDVPIGAEGGLKLLTGRSWDNYLQFGSPNSDKLNAFNTAKTLTSKNASDVDFEFSAAINNATIIFDPLAMTIEVQGHEAVNFGDDPYATFSSQHNTVIPEGVTAYRASSSNETSVRLTPIEGNVLPANTGVILEKTGETGAYDFDYTSEAASEVENLLAPSTGVTAEAGDFILSDNPWAFYPLSAGGALKANRAYLPKANLPTTTANAPVRIVFDETTDINGVQNTECGKQNGAYNLAGQKVSMDYKGIVIVNGKKFINK